MRSLRKLKVAITQGVEYVCLLCPWQRRVFSFKVRLISRLYTDGALREPIAV